MRPFRFALDPILKLRRQELKQIERQLAECICQRNQAASEADRCTNQLVSLTDQYRQPGSETTLHARQRYVASIERQAQIARQQTQDAILRWQRTHAEYVAKKSEIDALENYRQSERQRHTYEVSRAEQHELDEIILRDWTQTP